jgi:hypothetical protein
MILLNSASSDRHRNLATFSTDSDASAYFSAVEAAESTIGATARKAVNNFIIGLKADGLWSLIHQLYLYAGPDTLAGALVKAKGTGTRVNNGFVSGDFSPTLGLQGDGTSKYIANGFLQNSFAATSHSIFVYSSSGLAVSGSVTLAGCYGGAQSNLLSLESYYNYYSGRGFRSASYTVGNFPVISTGLITSGSVMGSRTSVSMVKIYQNGASPVSSTANIETAFATIDVASFALGPPSTYNSFSADRRQVEAFAQGLTDNQAAILHKRTATYVANLSAFSPLSLNPALWLDASDASTLYDATSGGSLVAPDGAIARWEDKSGGGRHAIQGASTKRPLRKSGIQVGKDIARFDGVNDGLQIPSITFPFHHTAFLVQSSTGQKLFYELGAIVSSFNGFYFAGRNEPAWAIEKYPAQHSGPTNDNADWVGSGWSLATFKYNGTGYFYKNGTLVSNATFSGTSKTNEYITAAFNIACRNQNAEFIAADYAELLIYPTALSDSDRASVEAYLTAKWLT